MNKKIPLRFIRLVVVIFIVALLFGCKNDSSSGDFLLLTASSDSKEYDYINHDTDMVKYCTYDIDGNLIKYEWDFGYDGTVDRVEYYTYDSDGNQVQKEYDYNNDGTIDTVEYYTYDSDGNQVQKEYDYNNDGTIDTVEYYTYDNDGNQAEFEWDFGNDGTIDWMGSGSDGATQVGPAITEEELRTASERITAGDQEYELETYLWRDFMPISTPGGRPLIARVFVVEQDGNAIAPDLKLEYLWVINGSMIWATTFSDEDLPSSPLNELDGIARNGPKWEPETQVEVVVGLRRGEGSLELLRAADQWIYMTQ